MEQGHCSGRTVKYHIFFSLDVSKSTLKVAPRVPHPGDVAEFSATISKSKQVILVKR